MGLEPREPDPANASKILLHIPSRADALRGAFQRTNEAGGKFPHWRVRLTLNFIRYVRLYAEDLALAFQAHRIDATAQAVRNLLEICIWTEFCEMSEENAKRFSDDAARDMRDLMDSVQAVFVSVNQQPEAKLAGMIDDLKAKAAQFNIDDIEAPYTQVNNAAGTVGRQLGHAKLYKAASKFAHPTALLLCMDESARGLIDSLYEIGAKCTLTCFRHIEKTIRNEYPDFEY